MVQSYNLLKRKPIYESDIYLTIGWQKTIYLIIRL